MVYDSVDALPVIEDLLRQKRLALFAGSGISVPSNLPSWDGFVDKYIEACAKVNEALTDPALRFDNIIDDARKFKDKDLITTITALKENIRECKKEKGIDTDFIDDKFNELFYSAHPNDYHKLIVSTDYNHIITTNYDNLLEKAADEEGYFKYTTRSYSYTNIAALSMAIYSGETSIIHAHGKIADIKLDEFVLTKDDYLSIMKHNPGFRLVINTIFLTNSVLFVGYGGSDPHFEDIIEDLNATLNWSSEGDKLPKCYIMLKEDKISPIRDFLNNKKRIDIIRFKEYDEILDFLREIQMAFPKPK